jgi:hypothetical protein
MQSQKNDDIASHRITAHGVVSCLSHRPAVAQDSESGSRMWTPALHYLNRAGLALYKVWGR